MKFIISKSYKSSEREVLRCLERFEEGALLGDGARNKIRLFPLGDKELNIKSFKIPNIVNKLAYRFLRKSKAERSYEYAQRLLSKGIGTPYPIAYAEELQGLYFKRSFYISEHLACDLTYRSLVQDRHYPDWENILRAFTRFTWELHEKHIEFLDHSPGNTLIRKGESGYEFFLVDLNRMNFREMDFEARMKNFSRLTPQKEMVEIMASEYARLSNMPEAAVFEKMWFYTTDFQERFFRKKALKKKLKFWKKQK